MRHLAATFMRSAVTLLVNLFGARIWIFILVSKRETRAFKRAFSLVFKNECKNNRKLIGRIAELISLNKTIEFWVLFFRFHYFGKPEVLPILILISFAILNLFQNLFSSHKNAKFHWVQCFCFRMNSEVWKNRWMRQEVKMKEMKIMSKKDVFLFFYLYFPIAQRVWGSFRNESVAFESLCTTTTTPGGGGWVRGLELQRAFFK